MFIKVDGKEKFLVILNTQNEVRLNGSNIIFLPMSKQVKFACQENAIQVFEKICFKAATDDTLTITELEQSSATKIVVLEEKPVEKIILQKQTITTEQEITKKQVDVPAREEEITPEIIMTKESGKNKSKNK